MATRGYADDMDDAMNDVETRNVAQRDGQLFILIIILQTANVLCYILRTVDIGDNVNL